MSYQREKKIEVKRIKQTRHGNEADVIYTMGSALTDSMQMMFNPYDS